MAIFSKKGRPDSDEHINEVLGWLSDEVVALRGKKPALIYANAAASKRFFKLGDELPDAEDYFASFPELERRYSDMQRDEEKQAFEFELEDVKGDYFSARAKVITWSDDKPALMLILQNITETRRSEERLFHLAYIDQLTNIPNRRRFIEDFAAIADEVCADRLCGMICIFDLDNFKSVNDTYGHNTGDLMLRRLTDHVTGVPEFKDHLYRLGGDEFVIMLHTKAGSFASTEEMTAYYEELLCSILCSYTIPNIELSCTLSIGAAFFPMHGSSSSDLLRKSDIALYKSKEAGRNCLTLFEDRYDTAKKFKDLYINIQPVLISAGKSFGYELVDMGPPETDEEGGGEDIVTLSEINRTLDALGLDELDNSLRYFINYTDQLLSPVVTKNLPTSKFIIQLHVAGRLSRQDVNRILNLRKNKYSICLVGISSQHATKEILSNAEYCKFSPADRNTMMQKRLIAANPKVNFIATEVNTHDDFHRARDTGFTLFQGFYFNEPVVTKKTKELNPISANYYRLIQLTSSAESINFKEISDIISGDVALTYKLLRLLNSAAVGLRNVSSVSMAVAYLGEENLKKWIGLLALRGIAAEKPIELVRMSLVRAQFGELLAQHMRSRRASKHLFLLGMLSLMHIAMDTTREALLEDIPVSEEIRDSLLTKTGPYSSVLRFFEDYEYGNWDGIMRFAEETGLSSEVINECYIEAVKWYGELIADK